MGKSLDFQRRHIVGVCLAEHLEPNRPLLGVSRAAVSTVLMEWEGIIS
jgi:hypothetical protein